MKSLSVLLALGLTACATTQLEEYRDPPNVTESAPKVTLQGHLCPSTQIKDYEKSWMLFEFKLNENGSPVEVEIVDKFPQRIGDFCYKKSFKQWKFEPTVNSDSEKTYKMLFAMKTVKRN